MEPFLLRKTQPFQQVPFKQLRKKTYKNVTVKQGETVLSIVHTSKPLDDVIKDFEELNQGVKSERNQGRQHI
ncbi:hypothetical protein BsIDN1_43700 [Bacillus safensis]|uniref:Uncharacterized protein n=1 Tax=Bacillus safensis TaxID=561879 RepID=A0A5S9MDT9_BACIA|nr:hypothetical protein BsIDN1_43700 [Bacillus safensis]